MRSISTDGRSAGYCPYDSQLTWSYYNDSKWHSAADDLNIMCSGGQLVIVFTLINAYQYLFLYGCYIFLGKRYLVI